MEKIDSSQPNLSEEIKIAIAAKIEQAKKKAVLASEYEERRKILNELDEKFIKSGVRTEEDLALEQRIENETIEACAIADTLPEFREMLHQIATKYGVPAEKVMHDLDHENAHATEATLRGFPFVTYGVTFIKNKNAELTDLQPACFVKKDYSWTPRQLLENYIAVTKAPGESEMSPGDLANLDHHEALLKSLDENEGKQDEY